ncbi:endonuclease V [Pedobacter nototheniae]|uniref:endonuclease V n=1 Tax=Pedobacter nototheniae TaxID=2488994 RepID=UPI00292DA7EC|nr:endonuclease V [Pedobacter nototheniae]
MYDHFTFPEADALQIELAKKLVFTPLKEIKTIAGADISFDKGSSTMYAGMVILSFPEMIIQSYALETYETTFPYKPGYLGFKEVPALLKVWDLIPVKPDVLVLDGNGILHPRRMGVASHFGVLANQPTIGCAKSILYGENHLPGKSKYSYTEIRSYGETLGYALRTKDHNKPVYISAGHLITSEQALAVLKKCIGNYRIPEPTRVIHDLVNDFRTGKLKAGFHIKNQPLTLF